MKSLFATIIALVFVGISNAEAQVQQVKAAEGRFYCQGVINWDLRMDVDFFGNTANSEIYNVRTGDRTYNFGYFDEGRSDLVTTFYVLKSGARIDFPADYQLRHWFKLTYRDQYGWIRFDCNHF